MTFAVVFPGQGSQSVGMLKDLAAAEPLVQQTFAEASGVLGYDLWQLVQTGPETALAATETTQPAMLTAGVATWRVWRKHGGPVPNVMAGHSLGEYAALVAADALDFATAVDLVRYRGQQMQVAVPAGQGTMAAILGVDDPDIEAACREAAQGEVVQPANFNSPGQVVIAGHATAVDRAIELLKSRGAKRAIKLPVSAPFHTPLMQQAADRMQERLAQVQFRTPTVRDVYTVDVRKHAGPQSIRAAMVEQLVKPVRWTETIQTMVKDGVRAIIECGPGRVLTGLNRRIERNKELQFLAIEDSTSLQEALQAAGVRS